MKFSAALIVVDDIAKSKQFYEKVLGQKVKFDFGENITFEGDFSLQSKASWQKFIDKKEKDIIQQNNSFELYFEEDNFDKFMYIIDTNDIECLHSIKEYP